MKGEALNLYQKLLEIRKDVAYLKKESICSSPSMSYSYVSNTQVLASVRKKMDELGVFLVPSIISQDVEVIATSKGGTRFFTKLEMKYTWINCENPEETLSVSWQAQGVDNSEKGIGKALTYSEKYFILKSFNIATDNLDPDMFQDKLDGVEYINNDKINKLILLGREYGKDRKTLEKGAAHYFSKSMNKFTEKEYESFLEIIKKGAK